ncbi:MAG: hypothetical protein GXO15_03085 [Crenarchaeota archaeon]|nr:hypothetical protein [Thermoproteota archaeon]
MPSGMVAVAGGEPPQRRGRLSIPRSPEGGWPRRFHRGLDPELAGPKAFGHPAVRAWWRWLREEYTPPYRVALVTPCSNVKPYTRSPTSRKIRGMLRRLGLWDEAGDKPRGIEWLYFSDLLILVPYTRAEEYPPCCYELPPDQVLENPELAEKVATLLAEAMERLVDRGLERLIVYLPRKHLRLWDAAKAKAAKWPGEERVTYSLFSTKPLAERLAPLAAGDDG